jgi:hypothetical protein
LLLQEVTLLGSQELSLYIGYVLEFLLGEDFRGLGEVVTVSRFVLVHHGDAFGPVVLRWAALMWLRKRWLSLERLEVSPAIGYDTFDLRGLLLFVSLLGQVEHLLYFEFTGLFVKLGLLKEVPILLKGVFVEER